MSAADGQRIAEAMYGRLITIAKSVGDGTTRRRLLAEATDRSFLELEKHGPAARKAFMAVVAKFQTTR